MEGGRGYLSELVGCPLNDDANTIINFQNRAIPSLVFPKHDMNLVPYKELLL